VELWCAKGLLNTKLPTSSNLCCHHFRADSLSVARRDSKIGSV